MVIAHLNGGLGNQMFQYAAGRALSRRLGVPLKMDIYDLVDRSPKPNFVHRDCDLGLLRTKLDFASHADFGRAAEKPQSVFARARLKWKRTRWKSHTVRELNQQFMPELLSMKGTRAHLIGYWQDTRYFSGFENVIREDFQMRGNPQSRFLDPIRDCNSVCINVRRTDFVDFATEREIRVECGPDYYQRALDLILTEVPDARLFGFSDDVAWCEANLKLQRPIEWIPHSEAGVRFGTYFLLMRNCRHFLIPNSTFAWWAAWLGTQPDKLVVSPKSWYRQPGIKPEGLIPKEWITLE